MRTIQIFSKTLMAGLGLCLMLSSCYEQEDPLEEIIVRTGDHYPVVANIRSLEAQGYEVDFSAGGDVHLELQYWSFDPIDKINFYDVIDSDTSLIAAFDYQAAFSKRSDTDTLVVQYTVPAVPAGTEVGLILEVVNENTLIDYGTFDFEVE